MRIEKVTNGYITTDSKGIKTIHANISDMFSDLLLHFEGKSKSFGGDSFGVVRVITKPEPGCNEIEPA